MATGRIFITLVSLSLLAPMRGDWLLNNPDVHDQADRPELVWDEESLQSSDTWFDDTITLSEIPQEMKTWTLLPEETETVTQPPDDLTTTGITVEPETTNTTPPTPKTTTTTKSPDTATTPKEPETTTTPQALETTTTSKLPETTTTTKAPDTTTTPKEPETTTTPPSPETTTTTKPPDTTTTTKGPETTTTPLVPETTTTTQPVTTTPKQPETTTTPKEPETTTTTSTTKPTAVDTTTTSQTRMTEISTESPESNVTEDTSTVSVTTTDPLVTTERWPTEEEGTVTIRIYNMSSEEFNETETGQNFTAVMSKYITLYCLRNDTSCPTNTTLSDRDIVISSLTPEAATELDQDPVEEDYILEMFSEELILHSNLLVDFFVARLDGQQGAQLTREVVEDAVTTYAKEMSEEFGFEVEVAAPVTTVPPPGASGLVAWQIALIVISCVLIVVIVIVVPIVVIKNKKHQNKLSTHRFMVNGRELRFVGSEEDMSMADILADRLTDKPSSESAKLVYKGISNVSSFTNGSRQAFENPNYESEYTQAYPEGKTAM